MKQNRIYYGEYSLEHWINLIVKGNIELPEFQRSFVWNKKMATELIVSIKEKLYVPPISIGKYESDKDMKNWIIDGQQRLTTILLSYIGKFPIKDNFLNKTNEKLADGENENEDSDEDEVHEILAWTLRLVTNISNDTEEIKSKILSDERYEDFDNNLADDFFKQNYLGFVYLVPDGNKNEQQKYYSDVFRNINVSGISLQPLEARSSLYFTDPTMAEFFDPNILKKYKVITKNKTTRLDFIRYLSTSFQYNYALNYNKIARGYRNDMERYYRDFIYNMVSQKKENENGSDYVKLFAGEKFQKKIDSLNRIIVELDVPDKFPSIIDMDVSFFGMIYYIIIHGKSLDLTKKVELINQLKNTIENLKKDEAHKRNPNTISRLRNRMEGSLNIYKNYAI